MKRNEIFNSAFTTKSEFFNWDEKISILKLFYINIVKIKIDVDIVLTNKKFMIQKTFDFLGNFYNINCSFINRYFGTRLFYFSFFIRFRKQK